MAATWTPVWTVVPTWPTGLQLVAYEASTSATGRVTLRKADLPGTRGSRCEPGHFTNYYGATPAEAITKFIDRRQQQILRAHQDIAEHEAAIREAEALRDAQPPRLS